ncbi:hypothetical protein BGX27_002753, partial [Mortierella sp. AM989]
SVKEDIPLKKKGQKSKVSDNTRRYLIRELASDNLNIAANAQKWLADQHATNIAVESVQQILREKGLTVQHRAPKYSLNSTHEKLCMDSVHKYEEWIVDDWKRIM